MKKILWTIEEAVPLYALYFQYNGMLNQIPSDKIEYLSKCYRRRAEMLKLNIDNKFRNYSGLSMQLACIKYVVTNGEEGFSGASRLFHDTYRLYLNDKDGFLSILSSFYKKYCL